MPSNPIFSTRQSHTGKLNFVEPLHSSNAELVRRLHTIACRIRLALIGFTPELFPDISALTLSR